MRSRMRRESMAVSHCRREVKVGGSLGGRTEETNYIALRRHFKMQSTGGHLLPTASLKCTALNKI